MINAIRQRWSNSKWFKTSVILIIGLIITGIIFQTVVGTNPATGGTSVLGDRDSIQQLEAGERVIHTTTLQTELNVVGFTSTPELQVFIIEEIVNSSITTDYLEANAVIDISTDQLSHWVEKTTNISIVIIAPNDTGAQYRYEIRSFDADQRSSLIYYSLGGFMYTGALLTLLIYLIMGEFLPWILYRGHKQQEAYQMDQEEN